MFDKLAPSNKRFKLCFKSFFECIPVQKTVSEALKTSFFYSAFLSAGQWGGAATPHPLATLLYYGMAITLYYFSNKESKQIDLPEVYSTLCLVIFLSPFKN